jgi:SAM-dependent methyltransferase
MSDLWQVATEASERFAAQAVHYDRYRPRYPESVFDDIVELANLAPGARAIEIGAGTGIATAPLVDRDLEVTAIEPAAALATVVESKLADRVQIVVSRFEDFLPKVSVQLLAAFNAWHWVEPGIGVELAAEVLDAGGSLALVWTEVISWGEPPFEDRLAETFGSPWEKRMDHVDGSMEPIRQDARFEDFRVRHHEFARTLDAASFVAVTKTYGGDRTDEEYQRIERVINGEFGGTITKVEDAALYLAMRV